MQPWTWVESVVGQGTTFKFSIRTQIVTNVDSQAVFQISPQLSGLRLLAIDDSAACLRSMTQMGKTLKLKVEEAQSLAQAMQLLAGQNRFDFIIIDANLNGVEGIAVANELKKLPVSSSVPMILSAPIGKRLIEQKEYQQLFITSLNRPIKLASIQTALLRALDGAKTPEATVKTAEAPAPPAAAASLPLAQKTPLKLLVTDDNVINQKVLLSLLHRLGYRADVANNGVEALQALESAHYDLVFMDVQMPKMDGLEATKRWRSKENEYISSKSRPRQTIIVALTARTMAGDREICISAGMDDFLSKPIRPEALQTVLEKWSKTVSVTQTVAPPIEVQPTLASVPAYQPTSIPAAPVETVSAASVPVASEEQPVDMERLLEFSNNDREALRELIELYLTQTQERLGKLQSAIEGKVVKEIIQIAHSTAGASATCGMDAIYKPLKELENNARGGSLQDSDKLWTIISREFARLRIFLDNYLRTH